MPIGSTSRQSRIDIVCRFADTALRLGRDSFRNTPLLADGVNLARMEPVRWIDRGNSWVICNPACQMNFFRTLVGLSNLTGDSGYRNAAVAEMRHIFDHYVDHNGLPYWGGHQFIDLQTGNVVGEQAHHEFKAAYPFYEFLFDVDPTATRRLIAALWNAHVLDWSNLDMTRHGTYNAPMGELWNSQYIGGDVFFEGKGLTFIRAGSDLVYAAGLLHHFTGETGPITWAKRLAYRYVEARDATTGLGAYQFSQPRPSAGRGQAGTLSSGGDRARNQLGPEFGERALEGKVFDPMRGEAVNALAAIAQLRLAEQLGPAGADFVRWTRDGMIAYAKHAYDPETNIITAMFTDGTRILPEDVKRPGYYSPAVFKPRAPSPSLLFAYALGWRLTDDINLWNTVRAMAQHHGIGDIGESPTSAPRMNEQTRCDDPIVLLALLEITQEKSCPSILAAAGKIADNIIANRIRNHLFVPSQQHANARFSALEPLAILSLEAALRDEKKLVPTYNGGQAYIQGPYDGHGRATDAHVIWAAQENT